MEDELRMLKQRLCELVQALGDDPWTDNGARRVCRTLLDRWAEEDNKSKPLRSVA